jgi:DNA-binding response OmpR family regulator
VPVIMLTALGEERDRIAGLEVGADDYVTKPFSPRELVLRVQSVLRRSAVAPVRPEPGEQPLVDGDLEIDTVGHHVRLRGEALPLTGREYDLLTFFLRQPGRAFSRSELLAEVWGWSFGDHSTVTVHVRRLREKLEADPAAPKRITTVWGVGYRYEPQT